MLLSQEKDTDGTRQTLPTLRNAHYHLGRDRDTHEEDPVSALRTSLSHQGDLHTVFLNPEQKLKGL